MARLRWSWLGAALAVYAAWCAGQFWVAHRWIGQVNAVNRIEVARVRALDARRLAAGLSTFGSPVRNATPIPTSRWLQAGLEGVVAMVLVLALGAALVSGGRRWWSLIVALLPAAVVVAKFQDGSAIGSVWSSFLIHTERWMVVGAIVDTLAVAVIVSLLVVAVPRDRAAVPAPTTLLRAALPAVILLGWWLIQNPVDADGSRKIWIAPAIIWVIAFALLASSSLPVVPKLVVLLVIAPYLSVTMLDELIGVPGPTVDTTQFVHHMRFAAGLTAYVVGVPALVQRAQHHRLGQRKVGSRTFYGASSR
jgi:hypothetical protein